MLSSPVLSFIFIIAIVASATLANPAKDDGQTVVEIITIDGVSKLIRILPQGFQLIPLIQTKETIRYILGQRASNDRLVSQASDSVSYNSNANVQLRLEYPTSGTGAVITYVEIEVNQSSNDGKAYVIAGGIGQRRIVIIVEGYNTRWFTYTSRIYGV